MQPSVIPERPQPGFCKSPTCSMCIVVQQSFDKEKCAPGSMFGKGVYTSGTSSKCALNIPWRAAVSWIRQASRTITLPCYVDVCRDLAGKAMKLTRADHNLVAAPTGFDSVRGVPGGGLNYDELVVDDNNQIRPLYLVIYYSTWANLGISYLSLVGLD
ncbi:hypothetical protein FRC04_001076 [Tulasnella sp. 424]|nr:hypothetical protein FRC04_001076 [Tulasnella sp. 424]